MRASRPIAFLLSAALLAACAPKKVASAPPARPTVQAAPAAEEPPPDLSPAAAPAGLLAVGRWRQPSSSVDTLLSWGKLPLDWRGLMTRSPSGVGSILAVDAPVELVVAMPPARTRTAAPIFAFSVGLNSLESALSFAKKQGQDVQRIAPGVFRVGGEGGLECAAARSLGVAPARLVCGSDFADVEELLPYATRGLPTLELGKSDVHVELRMEPLRPLARDLRQRGLAVVLSELSIDDSRFDRALAETARGVLDEVTALADDAERISLDIELDRDGGWANANLGASFATQKGWTVQTLLDMKKNAMVAPEPFWRLPADSEHASYAIPVDPKRMDGLRRTLGNLVENGLAHAQAPRRVRDEIQGLLEDSFTTRSPFVSASGTLPPNAAFSPSQEKVRQLIGWDLMGWESEPAQRFITYFDRIVRIYNDPQLRKLLGQRHLVGAATILPNLVSKPAPDMGAGAKIYELTLPPALFAAEPPPPPKGAGNARPAAGLSVFLAVVPAGKGSWLGLSTDRKALLERLRSLDKAPPSATLAQRPGLEELRRTPAIAGGFTTLRAMTQSFGEELSLGFGVSRQRLEQALDSTQGKGNTPIVTRVDVRQEQATEVVIGMRAPRAAITDLATALPILFAGGMLSGLMSD